MDRNGRQAMTQRHRNSQRRRLGAAIVAGSAWLLSSNGVAAGLNDALTAALILQAGGEGATQRQVDALDQRLGLAPPGSEYEIRLSRIVAHLGEVNGHELRYAVYLAPQVNAVAFANGEIRVFAGLMDLLDDAELTFVIGHEIGHVLKAHGAESLQRSQTRQLAGLAARLLGQQGVANTLSGSGLDALELHFGRRAELEADRFGLKLLQVLGLDQRAAVSALTKLATANGGGTGRVASWFSTHPDPQVRAEKLEQAIDP